MKKIVLRNGVEMPSIIMGTSVDDRKGSRKKLISRMSEAVSFAVQNGLVGFDTSRDYSNEDILGKVFSSLTRDGSIKREDIFITTKVGNGQQRGKNMLQQIDLSLKALKLDYIDLWLLHWPLPDYYIDNWKQLCEIYRSGKVRAIGIANARERHINAIEKTTPDLLPHVIQIEYHPFRTVPAMRELCAEKNIQIEAYSANCVMLPFVRENDVLNILAKKYGKTIAQIMMRWHVQQGTVPIFSSLNQKHILENIDIFNFTIDDDDMKLIFALNRDYKFHPESLNCPGY